MLGFSIVLVTHKNVTEILQKKNMKVKDSVNDGKRQVSMLALHYELLFPSFKH